MSASRPLLDRLAEKIDLDFVTGCWNWSGAKGGSHAAYGVTNVGRRQLYAHRAVWEETVYTIPAGLTIDHLCRNPACVNPDHLEPVTQAENLRRGKTLNAANIAKTRCPQGHSYDDAIIQSDGSRKCRTCNRERCRARTLRLAAA